MGFLRRVNAMYHALWCSLLAPGGIDKQREANNGQEEAACAEQTNE